MLGTQPVFLVFPVPTDRVAWISVFLVLLVSILLTMGKHIVRSALLYVIRLQRKKRRKEIIIVSIYPPLIINISCYEYNVALRWNKINHIFPP